MAAVVGLDVASYCGWPARRFRQVITQKGCRYLLCNLQGNTENTTFITIISLVGTAFYTGVISNEKSMLHYWIDENKRKDRLIYLTEEGIYFSTPPIKDLRSLEAKLQNGVPLNIGGVPFSYVKNITVTQTTPDFFITKGSGSTEEIYFKNLKQRDEIFSFIHKNIPNFNLENVKNNVSSLLKQLGQIFVIMAILVFGTLYTVDKLEHSNIITLGGLTLSGRALSAFQYFLAANLGYWGTVFSGIGLTMIWSGWKIFKYIRPDSQIRLNRKS